MSQLFLLKVSREADVGWEGGWRGRIEGGRWGEGVGWEGGGGSSGVRREWDGREGGGRAEGGRCRLGCRRLM